MPTQRPFFANFFSAFRARSSPTFQAKSSTTTGAVSPSTLSATAHISTTSSAPTAATAARTLATKASQETPLHHINNTSAQPIKSSNSSHFATTLAGSPGTTFYGLPKSTRPPSPAPRGHNLAISPPGHTTSIPRGRQRRDSGSSNTSGGFMDAMGTEKWYIGGRTATGEEKFYQLGLVTNNAGKRSPAVKHGDDSDYGRQIEATNLGTIVPITAENQKQVTKEGDLTATEPTSITLNEHPPEDPKHLRHYVYTSAVTPVHVLNPKTVVTLSKNFFRSSYKILGFQSCASTERLALELAKELDLWLWRVDDDSLLHTCRLYLVKKEGMPWRRSQIISLARDFSALTDLALEDVRALLRKDNPLILQQLANTNLLDLTLQACHYNADAMPLLMVHSTGKDVELPAEGLPSDTKVEGLIVFNSDKNRAVKMYMNDFSGRGGEMQFIDQRMQFTEMILHYCQQLRGQAGSLQSSGLRFRHWTPGQFLEKAASTLGYGSLTYSAELIPTLSDAIDLEIWQSDLVFENRPGYKVSAVWPTRKSARALNIIRACLEIKLRLQEAYQRGDLLPQEYQSFSSHWGEDVSPLFTPSQGTQPAKSEVNVALSITDETVARMLVALRDLRDGNFIHSDQDQLNSDAHERRVKRVYEPRNRPWLDRKLSDDRALRAATIAASAGDGKVLPLLQKDVSTKVLKCVAENDVTILTAATGSGKTTQIPQLIWDEQIDNGNGSTCKIVCTQPRRVSTISVARRVASERLQTVGQEIGYYVRFDDRSSSNHCGITYMTSGLLLRMLEGDHTRILTSLSHIVLDEVHNRDVDTDLMLTALKNLFNRSAEDKIRMPKIVLMSATIDAEYFADYFRDVDMPLNVSCINVQGISYPVTKQRLQDILPLIEKRRPSELNTLMTHPDFAKYVQSQYRLSPEASTMQQDGSHEDSESTFVEANELDDLYVPFSLVPLYIDHIVNTFGHGDILVFLPGLGEIDGTEQLLRNSTSLHHNFNDTESYQIFKLHSALYETNLNVFNPVPPRCRRIILATNIAETSITLPDVKFIIDTGMSRQSSYDQTMQSGSLNLAWVSKAEITQRFGRTGRTQPGHYFALYSNEQYESMSEQPQPELTRTNLAQIVLRVQESPAFQTTIIPNVPVDLNHPGTVLLTAPSAPEIQNIIAAGNQLRSLKALTEDGRVTALGKTLSIMPCDPHMAKAILLGSIFRCLNPFVFFGGQVRDCQVMANPLSAGAVANVRRNLALTLHDDNLADAKAFFAYDRARRARDFAQMEIIKTALYLRHDTYREISQTCTQLVDTLRMTLGLRKEFPTDSTTSVPYLFPQTPSSLNLYSSNYDLIKALAMSIAGSRLAIWRIKDWFTSMYSKILPSPRSVNHTSTKKAYRSQRMRREYGDILTYEILRILPKDKYPWACETSVVPPLSGLLFGESLRLIDGNKLMLNDWVTYSIQTSSSSSSPGENNANENNRAAKIIMEYRKALDRFLNEALGHISINPFQLEKVMSGEMKADDFNVYLREADHPHRKIIVDSVVDILAAEADARAARLEVRMLDAKETGNDVSATATTPPKGADEELVWKLSGGGLEP